LAGCDCCREASVCGACAVAKLENAMPAPKTAARATNRIFAEWLI